ncbi:DUF6660 family protein [Flavobacterium muglaense]|uniref:DUF6660 family protein n=1 Tax=Flavobacterium muglaense TaxID=2764716 RepID=UPI00293B8EBC|nr:DUF6660 family protein [Flavobacterium muglaense]
MKIWVTILSFIVLSLSTVPCLAFAKRSNCAIEKNCDKDPHECGNDCNGKCSPFYSCGTCIGFIVSTTYSSFSNKTCFITNEITQPFTYDSFVGSTYISKIWQPPKNSSI